MERVAEPVAQPVAEPVASAERSRASWSEPVAFVVMAPEFQRR